MGRLTTRRTITAIDGARASSRSRVDTLAVEEPLELRVGGRPLSVTMRTPGHDVELAHGLLLAEGVIGGRDDLRAAHRCSTGATGAPGNLLDLTLAPGVVVPEGVARRFVTTSACGICGTESIDAVLRRSRVAPAADALRVPACVALSLPGSLRDHQAVFDRTGGLHGAGLFTAAGEALCVREDIGRHNAVDKVVGWCVIDGRLPAGDLVLAVSGRASFELVQKAAVAGIPMMVAVSAPSSLAVDLAERVGITLLGFTRDGAANVYTHPHRIV